MIERRRHGPGIAAAGARPIEQGKRADRLSIDVVGLRQELQTLAVRTAGRAGGIFLRGAAIAETGDRGALPHQHEVPAGTVTMVIMLGRLGRASTSLICAG